MSETTKTDTIIYSNASMVREPDGSFSLYVGNEKLLGSAGINFNNGHWGIAIPSDRVRLCERVPAQPVYADNVHKMFPGNVGPDESNPKNIA